jgi:hypothetical protein
LSWLLIERAILVPVLLLHLKHAVIEKDSSAVSILMEVLVEAPALEPISGVVQREVDCLRVYGLPKAHQQADLE